MGWLQPSADILVDYQRSACSTVAEEALPPGVGEVPAEVLSKSLGGNAGGAERTQPEAGGGGGHRLWENRWNDRKVKLLDCRFQMLWFGSDEMSNE